MHLFRRAVGPQHGQATLEMALILPLLAVLTMGIIEVGLLLNAYITVVNLGRDGARAAVDGATNAEIRSVLYSEGSQRIPTYSTNVAVLIIRGHTSKASSGDTVGSVSPAGSPNALDPDPANAWRPDPCNPPGWTPRVQRSDIKGLQLDNSAGFEFVIVEIQYLHPTITRLPFASDIMVSTRSIIRTAASNVNGACS